MKRYPNLKIRINGHTDDRGSKNVNLKLSERRAKAVVDYLVEKGINPGRLQYKGYGQYYPVEPNTTEKGQKANRRVEFEIIDNK